MTPSQIAALLSQRNALLQRRDLEVGVDTSAIDAVLAAECKPCENNAVDLALGRRCATLPERADYGLRAYDIADMEQRTAETSRAEDYESSTEGHW